jgi:hypothetical protein
MKKVAILILSFIVLVRAVNAQTASSLVGKWKYYDVYNKKDIDSTGLKMAKVLFGEMTFYFKANGKYKAFVMNMNEEGKWNLDIEKRKIQLSSNKGSGTEIDFIEQTNDQLILAIGKGTMILKKTVVDSADEVEEALPILATVAATKEQVSGKWYLQKLEDPNKPEERMKSRSLLAKGTYFHFKNNGTYETKIFSFTEEGDWELAQDGKSIVVSFEKEKKIWNIKKINSNELILIRGATSETWHFSSTQ